MLIAMAGLMASGDAVMALGPGDHAGIAAGDVWTLLSGHLPDGGSTMVMQLPAWVVLLPVGALMIWTCRQRPPRRYRRRTGLA